MSMTGLSLADIGLTPSVAVKESTADDQTGQPKKKTAKKPLIGPMPIEPGSVFAHALYNVWKGTRTTIIKSPPGAGKSTLVARLAYYLHSELPTLPVTVVTPTNGSGQALITRIAEAFGSDSVVAASSKIMPEAWAERVGFGSALGTGAIAVQTIASAGMSRKNTEKGDGGLYIVDEAYQSSFSDTIAAIDKADQVLFVGDPGQIGPVVTVDTKVFDRAHTPPHIPAPIAFERDPEAVVLSLDHTYRLGQTTTDIIQHFYDFPFDSKRSEKYVEGHAEVETSVVATAPVAHDPDLLDEVCDKVVELLGKKYVQVDDGGNVEDMYLAGRHMAVVVAHNAQRSYVESRLAGLLDPYDSAMITVGTADSLQGGQWPAVVALDPFAGVKAVTDHHSSPGRLCVMLSRHTAHLSFITCEDWKLSIASADVSSSERKAHRKVRRMLINA